ncbi:MAG: hypothetical protein J1E82_04445 [Muribaculaceae bacterium]|nr:hypothetical protein [Muribaculaceae bacterium]
MKKVLLLMAGCAVSMGAFAATEITEGTEYYIRNAETGMWLNGGYSWGTKGIVKEQARAFQFEATDGGYKIKSSVGYVNAGDEIYLDGNGTSNETGDYAIEYADGYFTITDSKGYMTIEQDGDGLVFKTYGDAFDAGIVGESWESGLGALQSYDFYPVRCANYEVDNAKYWEFFTREEMMEELKGATENDPIDATFLIKAFMLDRNDADNYTAWVATMNGEESSIVFPDFGWGFHVDIEHGWAIAGTYGWIEQDNNEGTFVVSQEVTDAPAGTYDVYYRVANQPNTEFALTFNGVSGEVNQYYNDEGQPHDFWYHQATGILANRELVKKAQFTVGEDGKLTIKMTKDCEADAQNRFTFKSFIIKCVHLQSETTGVEGVNVDNSNAPVEYYNLQGVRVATPDKGIYIMKQGNKTSKKVIR